MSKIPGITGVDPGFSKGKGAGTNERRRRALSRGVLGHAPQKFLKI